MSAEADDDYTPYLLELREFHRTSQQRGAAYPLKPGEVVTVYDEGHPRGMWRLGRIEELIPSSDGTVRGVRVKVVSKGGQLKIIHRPIQHLYPLEVGSRQPDSTTTEISQTAENTHSTTDEDVTPTRSRSTRTAAALARDRIVGIMMDDD